MPSGNLGIVGPTHPDDIVDEAAERVDRRAERTTRRFMETGEFRSTVRDELLTLANEPPGPEVDTTVTRSGYST
jgi:hypothetical protein